MLQERLCFCSLCSGEPTAWHYMRPCLVPDRTSDRENRRRFNGFLAESDEEIKVYRHAVPLGSAALLHKRGNVS